MTKKIARFLLRGALCVVIAFGLFIAGWLATTGWWRALVVPSAEATFAPLAKPGVLALREGLPVLVLEGTPEAMGKRHGEALGPIIRGSLKPYVAMLYKTSEKLAAAYEAAKRLEPGIPDAHRRELKALAQAAEVTYEDLVLANCAADICVALHCSTFCALPEASGGPLVFGRNLDFPGFGILDGASFLLIARPEGKHAFAAPAWPGLVGVQSGMNEKGVSIADMVDMANKDVSPGVPHVFRMRAALEEADDVAEALALMRPMPAGSTQNLMLCDEKTAVAIEVGPRRFGVREPVDGLVFATNNFVSPLAGGPADEDDTCPRYKRLLELTSEAKGKIDAHQARRFISATSISYINLHAMVFVPAERLLLFARGTTLARATDGAWSKVPLTAAFTKGAGPEAISVETLPPLSDRPRRYDEPRSETKKRGPHDQPIPEAKEETHG